MLQTFDVVKILDPADADFLSGPAGQTIGTNGLWIVTAFCGDKVVLASADKTFVVRIRTKSVKKCRGYLNDMLPETLNRSILDKKENDGERKSQEGQA